MANLLHSIKLKNFEIPCNILSAPLCGYTNLATRMAYRQNSVSCNQDFLCYAEMVSADGLFYSFEKSAALLETTQEEKLFGIQIFGSDKEKIMRGFEKIKDFPFDTIDLNCGCSIKKVLKSQSGAYLLKNPKEIGRIIKALTEATDKPVTLKIRSGYNLKSLNYLEVLDEATNAGAQMITFHPRTCMQLFEGKADWSKITDMKAHSKIPVIGNGDLFSPEDAVAMMTETGCDGVMLARGLIDDPFLLGRVKCAFDGTTFVEPSQTERVEALLSHARQMVAQLGELSGLREFRKFIRGYLKGVPEVSKLRCSLNFVDEFAEFERQILEFFGMK